MSDVDSDIEHAAMGNADEFSLRSLDLVVKPPQDAFCASAMIILHEMNGIADGCVEQILAIGFLKEATSVTMNGGFNENDVWDGEAGKLHRSAGFVRSRMRYFP